MGRNFRRRVALKAQWYLIDLLRDPMLWVVDHA